MLLDPLNLREDNSSDLLGDGYFVSKHSRFHNVADQPKFLGLLFQTRAQLQVQHIRDSPAACS